MELRLKNAPVTIKKSNCTVGTVNTNNQGKATFNHDFGNEGTFNVSFHITPSSSSNISSASATTQVTGGITETVALTCSEDNQAPLISNVHIYGNHQIITKVTTNDGANSSQIEFITPQGQTTTRPWQNSSSAQGSTSFTHTIVNTVPGTYKIKTRLRDQYSNVSESPFYLFTMFGGDMFNFHISAVSRSSAKLIWNLFEGNSAFGAYKISYHPLGQESQKEDVFVSDVSKTSLELNNLNANTDYKVSIQATAPGASKQGISVAQSLRFKTISAPPVISNVSLTPDIVLAGEPVTIKAKITDPDSSLKGVGILLKKDKDALFKQSISGSSYNLYTSLTFKEPGETTIVLYAYDEKSTSESKIDIKVLAIERPRISWKEAPAVIFAGETYEGLIEILNREAVKESPVYKIDWGDKQIDDLPVSLKKEPFFPTRTHL